MKNSFRTINIDAIVLALLMLVQSILPFHVSAFKRSYNFRFNTLDTSSKLISSSSPNVGTIDNVEGEDYGHVDKAFNSKVLLASPGGPSQPEVQSFTPASADNMVDLFTGDFSYNIPLLDVDGYPINLAYSAGISMEQEASWVGLGWNLNPGVINRHLRGLPDDFNGIDQVKEEKNQKPNRTFGVNVGFNYEIFALDASGKNKSPSDENSLTFSVGASMGAKFNNYTGIEGELSFGPSFSIGMQSSLGVGLQFSSSSQGGASIGGNLSLGTKDENDVSTKLSIGSSFSSRGGFQQLTYGVSMSKSFEKQKTKEIEANKFKTSKRDGAGGGSMGGTYNFGMSTHTPALRDKTTNTSFTARFKIGGDIVGNDLSGSFTGYFFESKIKDRYKSVNSYGYMNLKRGQNDSRGQLDFNRENDGAFTLNTPALPTPILTYDIYSINGQGIGGSYRLDRKDIGYVFDPLIENFASDATIGAEVNLGATVKGGVDVGVSVTNSKSGAWKDGNGAKDYFRYTEEKPSFRDAGEFSFDRSDEAFNKIGGYEPVRFKLYSERSLAPYLEYDDRTLPTETPSNEKSLHFKSNQPLTPITIAELKDGTTYGRLHSNSYAQGRSTLDHHIGAFLVTKTDGMRYFYGLPAYSIEQNNVTFAMGKTVDSSPNPAVDASKNLITYTQADASVSNSKGLDNYYNSQKIPAYVHSYLLTSMLSPNYVDSDGQAGPTPGDRGDYILFDYLKVDDFMWKNPVASYKASYIPGLNTDVTDDKATYSNGKKELWYLQKVETKNYVVIFKLSNREDGMSAYDEHGGFKQFLVQSNESMKRIDEIVMYSKADYAANGQSATPIKTVHFDYNYSLCLNYDGNANNSSSGKLTLTEVYFTYGKSNKAAKNRYKFEYYGNGFNYNPQNVDRWGNYKENPTGISTDIVTSPLRNSDFPYVGTNKAQVDEWASAWNLKKITTPAGAEIHVTYESDDYAFVQHLQANQMFLISGVEGQDGSIVSISDDAVQNRSLKFNMLPGTTISDYVSQNDVIYFKAALSMDQNESKFDYVPGYAEVESVSTEPGNIGVIKLKPAKLKDNADARYNPLAVAGIQFGRNYLQRMLPPTTGTGTLPTEPQAILMALGAAFTNLREIFTGPNMPLWRDGIGCKILLNKSWIRLKNPNFKKLGGGYRVKEITTNDKWDTSNSSGEESTYTQRYIYEKNGKSTGVATYEPQIGGEENPWRQYVANDIKLTLAPDQRNYMETPFGEQLFPTPSVGYSYVEVQTILPSNVNYSGVGKTVSEFYTAKDFPTIAKRTGTSTKDHKSNLNLILVTRTTDELAVSQGFVVHNNDMHGKPKATRVYGQGQSAELSSVFYRYAIDSTVMNGVRIYTVKSDATLIERNGQVHTGKIGRTYDAVADFRMSEAQAYGGDLGFNLNYTTPFIIVPMILGANISSTTNQFKSASFTKVIESKGILVQTTAVDNISRIVTDNLAFDAETGEVLLTSVNNQFGDTIYNFTYPAHWVYEGMGPAYKNLGYTFNGNALFNQGHTNAFTNSTLIAGDEVIIKLDATTHKAWVTESTPQGVRMEMLDGNVVDGNVTYLKVLRSGRRNLQSTPVGTLTLSKNPLHTISSNVFEGVLSSQAIQYDYEWKSFCECETGISDSLNAFAAGRKGLWNPSSTYLHLTNRTQDFENQNTDIRKDGIYESYNPMFKLENGIWKFDKRNWTYTSEVVEFSPNGEALETKDALNRYSSVLVGYNQTLQIATAVNSQRRQITNSNFEDYLHNKCEDKSILWKKNGNPITLNDMTSDHSHTGKYSLKVSQANPILFSDSIALVCTDKPECDFSNYITDVGGITKIDVPFQDMVTMTYEINLGMPTPIVEETTSGIKLSFTSDMPFKVDVQLTDETGCYQVVTITNINN